MKIATFNVNGIASRLPRLLGWLARESPDVACRPARAGRRSKGKSGTARAGARCRCAQPPDRAESLRAAPVAPTFNPARVRASSCPELSIPSFC